MEEKKFNQFNYQNNFIKEKYDRVNLTVPKGKKEKIREAAKAEGKSVNDFINAAIDARMSGSVPEVQKAEMPAEFFQVKLELASRTRVIRHFKKNVHLMIYVLHIVKRRE